MRTFKFLTTALFAMPGLMLAVNTNDFSLEHLASLHLPNCRLRVDDKGKPEAIVSNGGVTLNLASATQQNSEPKKDVIGYWFTPSMDFLGRQKIKVATPEQAIGTIQLLHTMKDGPDFVKKKIYNARAFDGGWVVKADHDFKNYPGSVMEIPPFEILVNAQNDALSVRQRCYYYRGSAVVYTNTIATVYEREIKTNHGLNYPEALFKELDEAWKEEQAATKTEK